MADIPNEAQHYSMVVQASDGWDAQSVLDLHDKFGVSGAWSFK